MSDFRGMLLGRAFKTVPGVQYNRERRELLERAEIAPLVYEVILPEQGGWEAFRDATFPLLVRYLKAQGIAPEYPKMLVVAVFFRDHCHFLEGPAFMNVLRDMEDLNDAALHFRLLSWLAQTESTAAT